MCGLLLGQLQAYGVPVPQVPSVQEIASGRATIDTLRPVPIGDLLGREGVPPDPVSLAAVFSGRCVLVSGAGGSIGSELFLYGIDQQLEASEESRAPCARAW